MDKASKIRITQEIAEAAKQANIVVLTDFRGVNVEQITRLREDVRKAGGSYRVAKNTLMTRAFDGTDYESLKGSLFDTNAIAYTGGDPVELLKALTEFSKENGAFKVKEGVMEGQHLNGKQLAAVAKLPSREALLGQLAGTLAAPVSGLMNVLSAPLRNMLFALKEIESQKEGQAS